MNLNILKAERTAARIPRVSGDEPALNLVNLVFFQYSPRERG